MRKLFDTFDDVVRYLAGTKPIVFGVLFLFMGGMIVLFPILGTILVVTILISAFTRMKRSEREEEKANDDDDEDDDDKGWKEEWKVDWNEEWKDSGRN